VSFLSIEELSCKGSMACQEAFAYLRDQLKLERNVEETVGYEPLKETDAPSYDVRETPRVRVFFGEKLEISLYIPEKAVPNIKAEENVPESLRAWVDRAQLGGMSSLLRVQIGTKKDLEILVQLIRAVIRQ
jgi:hypothetical protein